MTPADPVTDDNPWGETPAPAAKVALRISTEPVGASLTVDGNPAGTSPTTVDVTPGTHQLRAELAGYEPATIASDASGRSSNAIITLTKVAPAPNVVTLFGPPGAQVFLQGRSIGFLPVQTELVLGTHAFKVVTTDGTVYTVNGSVTADTTGIPLSPP